MQQLQKRRAEFTHGEVQILRSLLFLNLLGIKSAIKVYKMGNGLKKDKEMEKLLKLDEDSGLESWIAEKLGQNGRYSV